MDGLAGAGGQLAERHAILQEDRELGVEVGGERLALAQRKFLCRVVAAQRHQPSYRMG